MNAWLFNSSHPQVWCGIDDNVLTERGEMRDSAHFKEEKVINLYIMKAKIPGVQPCKRTIHLKRSPFFLFLFLLMSIFSLRKSNGEASGAYFESKHVVFLKSEQKQSKHQLSPRNEDRPLSARGANVEPVRLTALLQLRSTRRADTIDGADRLGHSDGRALAPSAAAAAAGGSHEDGLRDLGRGLGRGDDDGGGELAARGRDGLVAADGDGHDALRGQDGLDGRRGLLRADLGGRADGDNHAAGQQARGGRGGLAASLDGDGHHAHGGDHGLHSRGGGWD